MKNTTKQTVKISLKKIILQLIFIFVALNCEAATISSTSAGGAWNSGSTWVGGSVPTSSENVTIVSGATVTVSLTQSCATLTVDGTLTLPSGSVTASSNSTIASTGIVNVQGGTLSTASGKSLTVNGTLNISSGTVTVGAGTGGSDLKGTGASANINMTGGLLQIGHDYRYDYSLATYSGGTVEFMGSTGGQSFNNVDTYYFYNVIIDAACTAGPGFSTKNTTVVRITNNLTIQTGGVCDLAATTANQAYTLTFGSTFQPAATYGSTRSTASGTTYKVSQFGTATNANKLTITCTVSATAVSNPICDGSSTTINATGVGSFTWSPAGSLSASTGSSVTASPTANTTYTLSSTACWSNTYTVTVNSRPSASPTNDGAICTGGTANLVANATGGSSYTYVWSGANLSATTAANPTATPTTTTTYSVTVSSNGCASATAYTTVTVSAAPSASPTTSGGMCSGGTASLAANASGGTGTYTYSWSGANLSATTVANPTATPTVTTTYTVTVSNSTPGCSSNTYMVTTTVNPSPAAFSVAGGGNYCQGSTMPHIMLSGSTTGVNYQLYKSGTLVATMAGTGSALDFGARAAGFTFTITAINSSTACTGNMAGSTVVTMLPAPTAYTMTGGGAYCSGGSGVHVGLSNSNSGIDYQLYNASSAIGSPLSGTGAALDFGLQTAAGTCYYVVAINSATGCTKSTTGSVGVTVNAAPWAFTVTGGGALSSGGSGVAVGLSSTVSNTTYQLYRAPLSGTAPISAVGSPVTGYGTTISLGAQTSAGVYSVVATNTITGCTGSMTGSATITSGDFKAAQDNNSTTEISNAAGIEVAAFPNPNNGVFTVKGSVSGNDENVNVDVINAAGQVVYQQALTAVNGQIEQQVQLNGSFANGMYLVSVHTKTESKIIRVVVAK